VRGNLVRNRRNAGTKISPKEREENMKLCYLARDNDAAPADEMCKNDSRNFKEQQLLIKNIESKGM